MKLTYSLILAAASSGLAFGAATAYTTPVGYESIDLTSGLNYVGLRLHQNNIVAGVLTGVGSHTVTDSTMNFTNILDPSKTYILEINSGIGFIQIIAGTAGSSAGVITTPDDLLAAGVSGTSAYSIRPCATLASIFGVVPDPNLFTHGFTSESGADQVWIPNAAGDFDYYYYDDHYGSPVVAGWRKFDLLNPATPYVLVTPASVLIPYDEGMIVNSPGLNGNTNLPETLVVSGEIKKTAVALAAVGGLNYFSTVFPVGSTLASAFGTVPVDPSVDPTAGGLTHGFTSESGADQVWIPNAAGDFDYYYYDDHYGSPWVAGWRKFDLLNPAIPYVLVNPANVQISASGVIINSVGGNLKLSAPGFYSDL